jgi:thiamine-phosphate pyrophosphorylase
MVADVLARRKLARLAARLNARNGHAGLLPFLVLMSDDERLPDPIAAARALPRGSMVIVRSRDAAQRARIAKTLLSKMHDLVVLIADDPGLAATLHADGVHLPEVRAHEASHWRALRPDWLITASAHSLRALAAAGRADAIFLSPLFETQSHPGRPALGAMRARFLALQARVPVYPLGGIGAGNAGRLAEGTFVGLAAIGGLAPINSGQDYALAIPP